MFVETEALPEHGAVIAHRRPRAHDEPRIWVGQVLTPVKRSNDPAEGQKLLDLIDEIDDMWKKTGGLEETRVNGRPS
jgi:hypothetical protein